MNSAFLDPAVYFEPAGKTVVDLAAESADFCASLLKQGATQCYAVSPERVSSQSGVATVKSEPWEFSAARDVDLVFFDPRRIDGFDFVHDVQRVNACLHRILSPDGEAYVIMRTGAIHADWDVYNTVSVTPIGVLPTSPFFYEGLMADFAVRPLKRLPTNAPKFAVDRIFRLRKKKPSLLLIIGHSQAGKTTLARDLRQRDANAHISSDYLFFELVRMKEHGTPIDPALADLISGGSFENAGEFFRGIEQSEERLASYLKVVASLLPVNKRLISFDLDLRRMEMLDFVKSFFAEAGFSTWVVTR